MKDHWDYLLWNLKWDIIEFLNLDSPCAPPDNRFWSLVGRHKSNMQIHREAMKNARPHEKVKVVFKVNETYNYEMILSKSETITFI